MTSPDDKHDAAESTPPDYDAMAKQLLDDWQARWKTNQLPDQLQQIQTQWQQLMQPALEIGQTFWQQVFNAPAEPQQTTPQPTEAAAHDHPAADAAVAEPVWPAEPEPVQPAAVQSDIVQSDIVQPDIVQPVLRPNIAELDLGQPITPPGGFGVAPSAAPAAAAPAAGADLRPPVDRNAVDRNDAAVSGGSVGPNFAVELARRLDGLSARVLRLESELDRLRKQQQ